jgi:hypothetical protein
MALTFKAALNAVPIDYRDPIVRYARDGVLPTNKLLLALVVGDYRYCVEETDIDLAACLKFLDSQVGPFSHGSLARAAQWENIKGGMKHDAAIIQD